MVHGWWDMNTRNVEVFALSRCLVVQAFLRFVYNHLLTATSRSTEVSQMTIATTQYMLTHTKGFLIDDIVGHIWNMKQEVTHHSV